MTLAPDTPLPDVDVTNGLSFEYEGKDDQVVRTVTLGGTAVTNVRTRKTTPRRSKVVTLERDDAFAAWWGSFIRGQKPTPERDKEPFRFMDLFSSVGGLSLGAMEALSSVGMRGMPLVAADVDPRALEVYKANLRPRTTIHESVRSMVDYRVSGRGEGARFAFNPTVTDDRLGNLTGAVDMILAGPPCQGHSSLNNHTRHEDPKNLLYLTVPAVAVAMGVRHVVIENVPNVVADKQGVVQTTMALLRDNGYNLTYGVLAADKFGWPQTRKRFFLVASLDTKPLPLGALNEMFARDALPVTWILDDLADMPLDEADPMCSVPVLSQANRDRVRYLFGEEDRYEIPIGNLRPPCHQNGTTYLATYGRMWPNKPAPTITGGFLTPGRGRFIHPTRPRVLTPREAARVQGFPDWFQFGVNPAEPPSRAELARWIGNAVPSLLGYVATLAAVGGQVKASELQEAV